MKPKSTRSTSKRIRVGGGKTEVIPAIEQQINENLRLIYRQCVEEGIPHSMQALVDKLHGELSHREHCTNAGELRSGAKSQQASGPQSD